MEFNPNEVGNEVERPEWATYVPQRQPKFKTYTKRGHALNAAYYTTDYILYRWNDEASKWDELYRHEGMKYSSYDNSWKRTPSGKIAEPLEFGRFS